MEQKRKLFSGFDIAVVALVILAALAWFFVINRAPAVEPQFEGGVVHYYMEVPNLTPTQAEAVQIGDALQHGARHIPIGRVVDVEIRPHLARVDDSETQTIHWQEVEGRVTLILTVATEVTETDRDVMAEGQFPIKGGVILPFTGPGFAFAQGIILGLQRGA
ncbi:MAG: DUF4330 domain-containing protein [Oscillospiraceae bacterium]|nr:DUF4330 domain-containing protein [Oscillospiraceae bacterium]